MPKPKPYSAYPTTLRGQCEICELLRTSPNSLQHFIDEGCPIRIVGSVYYLDKLAYRQWMGVKTREG